jgi:hypothetical protein
MLQRAYELLLMLASEAGASPTELETLQQRLTKEPRERAGNLRRN